MSKRLETIIFVFITFLIFLGMAYFGLKLYIEKKERILKQQATQENILEGIDLQPKIITVDYSRKIADGSPLVFGGSHTPPIEHESAWNKLEEAGVTMIRKDLYLEFTLPRDITIEEYKRNENNVQDVSNWDQKTISNLKITFQRAKEHNMKVIGIMGYSPKWLTYNGTAFGVPKDWEIFKDIVKKEYRLYRDYLDYVEVWNEPDHRIFLVTDGSDLSKEQAYVNIYVTVTNAIREVDNEINDGKKVKIIGGVESNAKASKVMSYFVNESEINIKPDILSFHSYDTPLYLDSLKIYENYSQKLGSNEIFITEWNNETRDAAAPLYKTGEKAMLYTSNRIIDYFKRGIDGANYFALLPINTNNRGTDENTMGFYRWINNEVKFLPQAKSWRILSKSLGLGNGESDIVQTTEREDINSIAFINSEDIYGGAFVNNTDNTELIQVNLRNSNIKKRAKINIYIASPNEDGEKVIDTRTVYPAYGELSFRYLIPQNAVLGIKIYEEKQWYDIFDPIIRLNRAESQLSPV